MWEVPQKVKKTSSENLGFVIFVAHSHTELEVWNSSPDLPDLPDLPYPPDQVSSTTTRDLPSTRAGGQDDVSSKQTPSNYIVHLGLPGTCLYTSFKKSP